jgi:tetratricopeptide (TPR) repeat protein
MGKNNERSRERNTREDVSLPVTVGVAYANFAEAVDRNGGDGRFLREKSLASLEGALKERGDLWKAQVVEGDQLKKLGRFDEAAEAFRKALAHARWDSALKKKLFRAMVASTARAANSDAAGPGFLLPKEEISLREKATKIVTRKPKSARIRKYYDLGRVRSGA